MFSKIEFCNGPWCPVLVAFLSSFTSLPVAYFLNKLDSMKDDRLVFVVAIVCMLLALVIPAICLRRFYRNVDPLIYAIIPFAWTAVCAVFMGLELDGYIGGVVSFYLKHGEPYLATVYGTGCLYWDGFVQFPLYLALIALFCHSSVLDLFVALELDQYVKGFMAFYFMAGEPYLQTSYGTLINYWDGTAHLVMYMALISLFCLRRSYREVGLYWIGSIMNSMVVFMPGNVIGTFDIKWSYLLNIPYMLVPVWAAFKFFRERPMYIKSYHITTPLCKRGIDCLFVVYFIGAGVFAVFRGLAVLGSKSALTTDYISNIEPFLNDLNGYPKMQMLCYMYYYLYYYLCAIYGLLYLKQGWMADWALLHAGASAQGQFVHILSSLHGRTAPSLRSPVTGLNGLAFWTVNLALLVVPQLFAWRCVRDPENCGRTHTIEVAEPRDMENFEKRSEKQE